MYPSYPLTMSVAPFPGETETEEGIATTVRGAVRPVVTRFPVGKDPEAVTTTEMLLSASGFFYLYGPSALDSLSRALSLYPFPCPCFSLYLSCLYLTRGHARGSSDDRTPVDVAGETPSNENPSPGSCTSGAGRGRHYRPLSLSLPISFLSLLLAVPPPPSSPQLSSMTPSENEKLRPEGKHGCAS